MSALRTIRSFSVEMMKIAADIKDADIQKLLAERQGKEYLEGGRLLTNTEQEAPYFPKMGGYEAPLGFTASGNYDLKAKKKKNNTYQKVRDYGVAGMKGGLTGLGILGAYNATRGNFSPANTAVETLRAAKAARRAATIGASASVMDRAYRHDELTKDAAVAPNPSAIFRSPAAALATSRQTGGFKSRVIHGAGKPPKTVQLGKKFRLP